MEFCIIAPTPLLREFASMSRYHLVLAQVTQPSYFKFYKEMKARGDYIILDNGAYELARFDPRRYAEIIDDLKPDLVVLPDILLGDVADSFAYSTGMRIWLESVLKHKPEWMIALQAPQGQYKQYLVTLQHTLEKDAWNIKHIGLPRALATHIFHQPHARISIAATVRDQRPDITLHALGMLAGNVHELSFLDAVGVSSIDSSAPVWRGWQGYRLEDEWPDIPVDFTGGFVTEDLLQSRYEIIRHNLEVISAILHTW